MKLLVATTNKHKLKEIRHILGVKVEGRKLNVKENGKTFEENAIKKARAGARKFKQLTIADDSGLMVNCLDGLPGVKSARFATPPTPKNLCQKLLRVMRRCRANRRAMFVCVIALARPDGRVRTFKGIVRGKIIEEMRGRHGFGYDPVFVPNGSKKTFAQMSPAFKNRISHRARALKMLKSYLWARSSVG
ncbi:RdgB/HAM1 family non-canonical purine NTP pyrophosphatase [Candidatus Saganbacteria bacterium]|nr:RdgB/HAM1 family non-canonical purine NTP pyrophosphatase [Candidatus Saganbacteria bacterium]